MFICYNGDIFPASDPVLKISNRSFLYGDGLFESMRMFKGRIMLLQKHLERLKAGMKILHLEIPDYFSTEFFKDKVDQLIKRNNFGGNARIRLNIFRIDGGLYTPENDNISYTISVAESETDQYVINNSGLTIDLFEEINKPLNKLSHLKTCNSLLFVLAGIWKSKNNLDDCLILNESGRICEGLSSNVFIVKGKQIFTPYLSEGCINGVMRGFVIRLLINSGFFVTEDRIEVNDILNADELFLTNASSGLRWVGAFRNKRYFSKQSKEIINLLNDHINESE